MWTTLLDKMLTHMVRVGTLRLTLPDGTQRRYGSGAPEVGVTLHERALVRKLILNPYLAVGEGYMEGQLTIEGDDLRGFFALIVPNANASGEAWFQRPVERLRALKRWLRQRNSVGRARANVAHHYDLSPELYDLFLDEDRQYSCAYFPRDDMSLEEAQAAKKQHIAAKLLIKPGMRVLDVGCGWGGMGLTLARDFGAQVVGVTLSEEQYAFAKNRVKAAGLEQQVDVRLTDYRLLDEPFDRIVSVGMFEHVGVPQYDEFFRFVKDSLTDDGLAVIHTIGHTGRPNDGDPWTGKYIFPGGYAPTLGEIMKAVDAQALVTTDVESWRLHYARTLDAWYERFMANESKARALYDARFVRMWRYYLMSSQAVFRPGGRVLVYQLQLGKRLDAAPITRDYLCGT